MSQGSSGQGQGFGLVAMQQLRRLAGIPAAAPVVVAPRARSAVRFDQLFAGVPLEIVEVEPLPSLTEFLAG